MSIVGGTMSFDGATMIYFYGTMSINGGTMQGTLNKIHGKWAF